MESEQINVNVTCNASNIIDFLLCCKKHHISNDYTINNMCDYANILHAAILDKRITPTQYYELHEKDTSYLDFIDEMNGFEINIPSLDSPHYANIMKANEKTRKDHEIVKSFINKYNAIINPLKVHIIENRTPQQLSIWNDPGLMKKIRTLDSRPCYDAIINDCNRIIAAYEKYPNSVHLSNTKHITNTLIDYDRDRNPIDINRAIGTLIRTNFQPLGGRFDPLIDGPEDVCVFTETAKAIGIEIETLTHK